MNEDVKNNGDTTSLLKRAAEENDDERTTKQKRTEATIANMVPTNACATDQRAVFDHPHDQNNLFYTSAQPLVQQSLQLPTQHSMMLPSSSVPATQDQHIQMQMQQRQQQQQYAASIAARQNTQQVQASAMTTVMEHDGSLGQLNHINQMSSAGQPPSQVHAPTATNEGANFVPNSSSGISGQQQPIQATAPPVTSQMPNTSLVPKNLSETEEPCLICKKKGDIFTCNGGCGLHVHPLCIGEFAIFPFVVGQLCGSCFIVQQNRASPEDLTKGGPNALSVRRAILCINLETNSNTNFDKFGHLASLRLGEIGSIAGYPIKPFAEKFVEPYLQRWIREKLVTADKWMLNVREVFTVMIGLYSLKRACIAHSLHDKVIELMKARKFTVVDYFGWHPAIESPTVRCSSLCAVCGIRNLPEVDLCSRCHHKLVFPTTFTKYISTLLAAFYAEQVGIPLGASTLDVFAHTNTVRGLYKGLQPFDADGVVWELFTDQLRMIFGFLDIMSNFGTLQLNPDLFVPEVNIIYNPAYVNQAMINNEFEVVGKFLQCMKLFGLAKSMEHKNMIESCERYLLFKHLPNGSWCKTNGSIVDQYKATVTCSKALLTPQVRGYGPISQEFQRLLVKWARTSSPKLAAATTAGDKQLAGTGKHKLLASGAMVRANTLVRFKRLEAMYKQQIAPQGRDASLESLMTERMKQLLKAKKLEAESKAEKVTEEKSSEEGTCSLEDKEKIREQVDQEALSINDDTPMAADGTTDSEDFKSDHPTSEDDPIASSKSQDDDEMLTNMSLHEDLEIFDGLQFEDGGGVIDLSYQSLATHGEVADDSGRHAIDEADGTDATGQDDDEDDTIEDHMYDDDEDEIEQEETTPHQSRTIEEDGGTVSTDFPPEM